MVRPIDFPANPYVGPRAFAAAERRFFFGRDREVRELADLLIAERVVLLHAPSGAGKTSLIRAGLLPKLAEDFDVLPIARVAQDAGGRRATGNRYVFSTLLSWQSQSDETAPEVSEGDVGELADLTLSEYLARRTPRGKPQLLVFDQFEELVTAEAFDQPAKQEFFRQLGEVLRRTRNASEHDVRWALFGFREEYLATLQPHFKRLPGIAPETYRLELLGPQAAMDAVCNPAQAVGVTFREEATQQLIDDLRRVHDRCFLDSCPTEMVLGEFIEPVQLQVVCYRLWAKLAEHNERDVTRHDIVTLADVDNALGGYYSDKLTEICAASQHSELEIRSWFNERLITDDGHRAIVQLDAGKAEGIDAETVQALLDSFLVRREERRGLSWLELTHDRMVEPIKQNNDRWLSRQLQPFQLQAQQWVRLGKPDDLLIKGPALAQAQTWRTNHDDRLRPLDRDFLVASEQRVGALGAVSLHYYRKWAYVATIMTFLIAVAFIYAFVSLASARHKVAAAGEEVTQANQRLAVVQGQAAVAETRAENAQREAEKAKQDLAHLAEQAQQTQKDLEERVLTVLRAPMRSAAGLATARTKNEARQALDEWNKMFEQLGPPGSVNPDALDAWHSAYRIIASVDDESLPPDTQRELAYETLRLSQSYGQEYLHRLFSDDKDLLELLKPRLYDDAVDVTRHLAENLQSPDDLMHPENQSFVARFWQLYFGELPVVEGADVARAMMEFGAAMGVKAEPETYRARLQEAAQAVERACQRELRGAKTAF